MNTAVTNPGAATAATTTAETLIADAQARGVQLWFEGDRLRFRAPKGALTAETQAALSQNKDEIVRILRAAAASQETVLPATKGQQMHWFIRHSDPDGSAYNIGQAIRISSPVDVPALRRALQAIVDRHAALRSRFTWDDDGPAQRIPGWTEISFEQRMLSGVDEAGLYEVVADTAREPFNLIDGPLFRAVLHTRAATDHVLVILGHHIVFDGGSIFKVLSELRALYAEEAGQEQARLAAASGGDPAAFSLWHSEILAGPEGARMEAYWKKALANLNKQVALPPDRSRGSAPQQQTLIATRLDAALIETVRRGAAAQGVTPFVLFLAAYQAVLRRWTGADDVIVGTPAFFGRAQPEFTDAVGDFVNILPLRVRLTDETTLADLVAEARQALSGAIEAQELPFARIVEIVQPERVAGQTPLVSAMITLQRFDELQELGGLFAPEVKGTPFDFAGLQTTLYTLNWLPNAFDLQLQLINVSDRVQVYWGYDAALFDAATIEQFNHDYLDALRSIATNPERTVADLSCSRVTPAEAGAALLARLAGLDIHCALDGDKLKVNAPKGALDETIRAELAANRDAVIAALKARPDAASTGGIPPLAPGRSPELSFAQRRLWFLDQMDPGSVRYNIGGGARLRGALDADLLRLALGDVFARHEAFRTCISTIGGAPRVEILEQSRAPIEFVDLSDVPAADRDAAARTFSDETLTTPLDLGAGVLARARVARFADDDHVLVLVMHHIVSDGWSLAIIQRDLRTFYEARRDGASPDTAPPKVRYVDFATWEQDRAAAQGFAKATAYWKRTLAGAPPLLDLPADHSRPISGSTRGGRLRAYLDQGLIERLNQAARGQGATLFMALMGVWQALLARLSGQEDVVVGTTVANRDNVAIEDVVGFLVNNVPVRGDLSEAPSFAELMTRTRQSVLGAFEHAGLPFEALVEAVNPERTAAHAPVFQTLLTLLNFPMESVGPGGVVVEPVDTDIKAARFDLSLDLIQVGFGPHKGQMMAAYEYAADLFDEATVRRWHEAFERLIEAACETPDRSLGQVPLMAAEEARAFYALRNDTALEHDRTRPTQALLEASARTHPDDLAVVAQDGRLTYAAFEARANQLANRLIARGVTPGSRVAVCLERGVDLPVALAAAWKAGAAYVPLDPAHPPTRLRYVLEDAEVACAVTTAALDPVFQGLDIPLVRLDADSDEIAAAPVAPTGVAVAAEEIAYVIYTSGSTGRPKGVEVEHRNLVAFLEAMRRTPGLRHGETLLAVTTPSFDIAGLEMWLPLATGATVLIASREDTLDGQRLARLLEDHRVTLLQATPATWRLMLEAGWGRKPDLVALCGGEAMPRDLAQALVPRVAALWNVYGPTETTIWSTIHKVEATDGVIPIGGPIANTRIYVLDASGAPAPIGAPGELVITGEGVARGYRNRPDLNAEKFVEVAPFGQPERAFRTGDLARWRSDGTLDFLGRGDGQVKIRGFRIELGEIEARLSALPAVTSAVVAAREDVPGEKRLVAYLVMAPGVAFDEARTRAALRETLPDYMAPSAYVQLDRLPLSPNGKVDRKMLPAPSASAVPPSEDAEALMTPVQRKVAALWRDVLRVDRIGLHQNFFDVGGHSLLLVKLQAALKAAFGQEVAIVDLFQSTTVAAQAERFAAAPSRADDALERARARARKKVHG